MSESYCLKSCADCGQCTGCRGGAYTARCDIAKCCREKNHENCDSCTRGITCPTRSTRDMMPQKIHDQDRREAERLAAKRVNAGVMAKWVSIIFWYGIAAIAVGLLSFLEKAMPAIRWVELAARAGVNLVVVYGYWRMKDVDDGFRTYAILVLITHSLSSVQTALQEGPLRTAITIPMFIVCVITFRIQYLTFRDALSGIDADMSEKWLKQWNLLKISLLLTFGGLLACVILSVWGLVIPFAGMGIMLFVVIRDYVYLYQTAQICRYFSEREN